VYQPPPPQVGTTRHGRDNLTIVQRLVLLVALVGVVAGVALALVPLPAAPSGNTCGPHYSSDSAVAVVIDPSSVNVGSTGSAQSLATWQAYCQSLAGDRLVLAGVVAGASIVVGGAGAWLFGKRS
jgi:hypothetical protein